VTCWFVVLLVRIRALAGASYGAVGEYVAETVRQRKVFGPPPAPEQAIAGFLSELGYTVNAETRGI
jgi:hypothetical protein